LRRIISEEKQRRKLQNRKKKELRDFITGKIERLIEEKEENSKQRRAREVAFEVEIKQEGLKNLSMQERTIATP
jgi:hypothetical protein